MSTSSHQFHLIDYLVFIGTVLTSTGIGIFVACYKGGQSNNQQYFFGDRKMAVLPVSMSILITYISAIGTLGYPAEVHQYGPMFVFYPLAMGMGSFLGAFTFLPLLYPLKLTCVNEYYQMRFRGKLTRYAASMTSLIILEWLCSLNNFAPAVALEVVTGIPAGIWILAIGFATTFYTTIGGIKGVIYTDLFQTLVIFLGMLALTVQGVIRVGGLGRVFELNSAWGRDRVFDFDPDPTKRMTFWGIFIVTSLVFSSTSATQQNIQRYGSLSSLRKAQLAQLLNIPGYVIIGGMMCFCGMVSFAYYADLGCDPIQSGKILNPNQILPYFAMDVLRVPGLPGLFIAALVCASISSQSTSYNSMAAITWDDYLKTFCGRMSPRTQTTIIKLTVFIYGMLAIALSFLISKMGGSLVQLAYSILGSVAGPLFGLMVVASMFPFVNEIAPSIGVVFGIGITMCLSLASNFHGTRAPPIVSPMDQCSIITNITMVTGMNMTQNGVGFSEASEMMTPFNYHNFLSGMDRLLAISFLWYPFIGFTTVIILSLILSVFPAFRMKRRVPSHLVFSFVNYFGCPNLTQTSYDLANTDEKNAEANADKNGYNLASV